MNLKLKNIDIKSLSQKNRYSSVSTIEKPKTFNLDLNEKYFYENEKSIKENAYGLSNIFPPPGLHSQTSFHKHTNQNIKNALDRKFS